MAEGNDLKLYDFRPYIHCDRGRFSMPTKNYRAMANVYQGSNHGTDLIYLSHFELLKLSLLWAMKL